MPAGRIFTPDPVADHPTNDGLAAWWLGVPELGGGRQLFDLLGRRPATLTNGPAWVGYDGGGPEAFGGLLCDGSNDYAPTAANLSAILGGTAGVTLSVLFRPTSTAGVKVIAGSYQSGAAGVQVFVSSGSIVYQVGSGAASAIAGSALTAGRLTHAAVTWDGTTVRGYLDGRPDGTPSSGMVVPTFAWPLELGRNGDGNYFGGLVADARVYPFALTAGRAWGLYDQTVRGHPDTLRRVRPWVSSLGAAAAGGGVVGTVFRSPVVRGCTP